MLDETHVRILLVAYNALVGEIPPNLRAVSIRHDDRTVALTAYFDGEPSEDDVEGMSVVETRIMAGFAPDLDVTVTSVNHPAPLPVPAVDQWLYGRKE